MLIELYQPITNSSILITNAGTIVPLDTHAYEKAWERIVVYNQLVLRARNAIGEYLEIKVDGTVLPAYITDAECLQFWYESHFTEVTDQDSTGYCHCFIDCSGWPALLGIPKTT